MIIAALEQPISTLAQPAVRNAEAMARVYLDVLDFQYILFAIR